MGRPVKRPTPQADQPAEPQHCFRKHQQSDVPTNRGLRDRAVGSIGPSPPDHAQENALGSARGGAFRPSVGQ